MNEIEEKIYSAQKVLEWLIDGYFTNGVLAGTGGRYHIPPELIVENYNVDMSYFKKSDSEIIICAAIQMEDGRIFYGHRHSNCRDAKYDAFSWTHNREQISKLNYEEGFITSNNRFVDRKQAWDIAEKNNQITRVTGSRGTLYSEDLY